jgi:hypothetical protein
VLNAATSGTRITLSSHGFGDGGACLLCLYLPDTNTKSTEQQWADDMGLAVEEVLAYLRTNEGVSESSARQVERHRGEPDGALNDLVGKPIQSFYQGAVCGESPVTVGGATIIAPLAFISAAAGVGLAAELIKSGSAALSAHRLENYFRADTLFRPNPAFHFRRPADASGRCICSDQDYRDIYAQKYPSPD